MFYAIGRLKIYKVFYKELAIGNVVAISVFLIENAILIGEVLSGCNN
jgi:hypothetical protein